MGVPGMGHGGRRGGGAPVKPKKSTGQQIRDIWPDLREMILPRRGIIGLGFGLMMINRLSGLILPASTKYLIDDVIGKKQIDLLQWLVLAVLGATIVQGLTSFALTQILSKAGQSLIAELRQKVQRHIGLLPVAYYDANKSGTLVSRIMTDVEGVRNLIGTGLVDFAGGLITAVISLVVLLSISPIMTAVTALSVGTFSFFLSKAFVSIRPVFRERGMINAEVTGRLTESLGGVRVVKGYHAEEREAEVFSKGALRLLENVFKSLKMMSLMSLSSTVLMGLVSAAVMFVGARQISAGTLSMGEFVMFTTFLAFLVAPVFQVVGIGTQLTDAGLEEAGWLVDQGFHLAHRHCRRHNQHGRTAAERQQPMAVPQGDRDQQDHHQQAETRQQCLALKLSQLPQFYEPLDELCALFRRPPAVQP